MLLHIILITACTRHLSQTCKITYRSIIYHFSNNYYPDFPFYHKKAFETKKSRSLDLLKNCGRWGETEVEKDSVNLFPIEPTDETFERKKSRSFDLLFFVHCGRWDLNPHENTPTRSLVLLVCQFRHFRLPLF